MATRRSTGDPAIADAPGAIHPQTHIDRLAVIARLVGAAPASVRGSRVLDLACADGTNLASMACSYPGSEFLGLAPTAALRQRARETSAALGLKNITFLDGGLDRCAPALREYDYILAHGLYARAGPEDRALVLELCHRHLAPRGVALITYRVLPGFRARAELRDALRLHTRDDDPELRIVRARALARFLAEYAAPPLRRYAQALADGDDDDGAPEQHACYFSDFVAAAATHGLQYLADADYGAMLPRELPPPARARLEALCDGPIEREQCLDFLRQRSDRSSLLCRRELALSREPASVLSALDGLLAAARPQASTPDAAASTSRRDAWIEAALVELRESWPRARPIVDVGSAVVTRLGLPPPDAAALRSTLTSALVELYRRDVVELRTFQAALVRAPGRRPVASTFARHQAARGGVLCTHHHTILTVQTDDARALISLLDGTRTRAALVDELSARALAERWTIAGERPPARRTIAARVD
ncbi:MAG: class I SAM-dependent methyltransferase, partial [Myxococcales bacterium]|nr:class I SAM-dependent methyltransferase [Myxococcales bacterium]